MLLVHPSSSFPRARAPETYGECVRQSPGTVRRTPTSMALRPAQMAAKNSFAASPISSAVDATIEFVVVHRDYPQSHDSHRFELPAAATRRKVAVTARPYRALAAFGSISNTSAASALFSSSACRSSKPRGLFPKVISSPRGPVPRVPAASPRSRYHAPKRGRNRQRRRIAEQQFVRHIPLLPPMKPPLVDQSLERFAPQPDPERRRPPREKVLDPVAGHHERLLHDVRWIDPPTQLWIQPHVDHPLQVVPVIARS